MSKTSTGSQLYLKPNDGFSPISGGSGESTFDNGSVSAPSITFTLDPDTGLYLSSANTIGVTTGGNQTASIDASEIEALVPVRLIDGTGTTPAIAFTNETNTGFIRVAANRLGGVVNGSLRAEFNNGGLGVTDGTSALPSINFFNNSNTGLFRVAGNTLGITTGGAQRVSVSNSEMLSNQAIRFESAQFNAGSDISLNSPSGNPGIILNIDGIQRYDISGDESKTRDFLIFDRTASRNILKFTPTSGTTSLGAGQLDITSSVSKFNNPLSIQQGTTTAPGLYFGTDTNTGLFQNIADEVLVGTAGAQRLRITNTFSRFLTPVEIFGKISLTDFTSSNGPAAIPTTCSIHVVSTEGTGDALTLANSTNGHVLYIVYTTESDPADTAILTPATTIGFTTITFNSVGDNCQLVFIQGQGWSPMSSFGAVIA